MSGIKDIGEYKINEEKPLGKGSFGTVYKVCKNGNTDIVYAMKRISLKGLLPKDIHHCREEINWMKKLQHRNIIQYHDSFEIGEELFIVMEFCQGGSLRNYIQKSSPISETECLEITNQSCAGLKFLHDQKIMHRDIKTGNIFLQGKVVKLGDLALLRLLENPAFVGKITKKVGTLAYMSPEMIAGKSYGFETDIWSLGCCLYEMAMNDIPYPAKTEIEVEKKIRLERVSFEGFPYDSEIQKLLERMLEKDPSNRPTIDTVSQQIQTFLNSGKVIELEDETVKENEPKKKVSFKSDASGKVIKLEDATVKENEPKKKASFKPDASGKMIELEDATFKENEPKKNILSKSDASSKRFMATFPSNRPKSTRSLDSLVEETGTVNISGTEPAKSARQTRRKTKTKIVHIPVKVSEDDYNMMCQADYLQQVLERDYLSDVELEKMFKFLQSNMEEKEFLDKMQIVVGDEKFKAAQPFLMSFWLFKSALLKRNYKMVCERKDR